MVLDSAGSAYLAGSSSSPQFPALPNVPNLGADFILRLDSAGAKAQTLFRLPHGVIGMPPILNGAGELMLASSTGAVLTLPTDYAFNTPAIVAVVNSASYSPSVPFVAGKLMTLFGFDLGGSGQNAQFVVNDGLESGPPTTAQATLLYAGPNQINLQTPFEVRSDYGQILVTVPAGSVTLNIPSNSPEIEPVLGLFTTDGVHAAALNQDGSVNSAANPAAPGSIVSLFGTGAYWTTAFKDGAAATSATPLNLSYNDFEIDDSDGLQGLVLYAGTAPGLLYGVFQVNVQLALRQSVSLTLHNLIYQDYSNTVQIYLQQ